MDTNAGFAGLRNQSRFFNTVRTRPYPPYLSVPSVPIRTRRTLPWYRYGKTRSFVRGAFYGDFPLVGGSHAFYKKADILKGIELININAPA